MSDASVAALLRSAEPLVVIEAPAGCGKTFQGAAYAREASQSLPQGRVLILTHTHGACGVFAERTRGLSSRVDIRTIDSLISQVSHVYRRALDLPDNLSTWAYQNNGEGFDIMATKVAGYMERHPIVREALARRYPLVICDEHQDASEAQHRVIAALRAGGARLRIFGDPLQAIFASGSKSNKAMAAALDRWEALKAASAFDELDHPHRWDNGSPELGRWVLDARSDLRARRPISLIGPPVVGLSVLRASNVAQVRTAYQVSHDERRSIDAAAGREVMVLAASNDRVRGLSAFWDRRIPIWEGHTRSALADLVRTVREQAGQPVEIAQGVLTFAGAIGVGFSPSSHGERLVKEVREGCARPARGKPALIQRLARHITDEPNHHGVAGALSELHDLIEAKAEGFGDIKIVHRTELRDAIRLKAFACPDEGYAEIARRRSHALPVPPRRSLSTIHKAKGLECDNAILIAGDQDQFGDTDYARCKLYVALSRAKRRLTLVVSRDKPSPLFRLA